MSLLIALAAAAASASVPPPPAPGAVLWRGARVGMSTEEVEALFPKGHPAAGRVDSGAVADWAVPDRIYGAPATVTFYFQNDSLVEALVEPAAAPAAHETAANVERAHALAKSMTAYYGKPKFCADETRRGLHRVDCEWTVAGARVGLSYVDYGGASPSLTIAFRAPTPPKRIRGLTFGPGMRRAQTSF